MEIRDRVLDRETYRVFYAMFPEAPHRLDSANSEHSGYVAHWISIRDDIVSRAPEPGSDDDEAVFEAVAQLDRKSRMCVPGSG